MPREVQKAEPRLPAGSRSPSVRGSPRRHRRGRGRVRRWSSGSRSVRRPGSRRGSRRGRGRRHRAGAARPGSGGRRRASRSRGGRWCGAPRCGRVPCPGRRGSRWRRPRRRRLGAQARLVGLDREQPVGALRGDGAGDLGVGGDGVGIAIVVLLRLHVRLDIFRRHQPHRTTLRLEEPPEVMRAAAGLHRHYASRRPARELDELRPRHAPPQDHSAAAIQRRDAAAVLPQSNPDDRYGHGAPFLLSMLRRTPCDPSPEGRAIPQSLPEAVAAAVP